MDHVQQRSDRIDGISLVARGMQIHDPDLRRGQALYNALAFLEPAIADALHSTPADPFFDDKNIAAFWAAL